MACERERKQNARSFGGVWLWALIVVVAAGIVWFLLSKSSSTHTVTVQPAAPEAPRVTTPAAASPAPEPAAPRPTVDRPVEISPRG